MNPPCPHCNSAVVAKDGFTSYGKQKYICGNCRRRWHKGSKLKVPSGRQCYYCGRPMAKWGKSRGVQYYLCCGIRQNDATLDKNEPKYHWKEEDA